MRKKLFSLFIFIVLIFSSIISFSKENFQVGGKIKLFTSFFMSKNYESFFTPHNKGDFLIKRIEAGVKFSGDVGEKISYNLRFNAYTYPGNIYFENMLPESGMLGAPVLTEYYELNIYEANAKISDFIIKGLDLTVGKQRIFWGTADKLNVLDNLNPVDFANFFTFDPDYFAEKRPQTALNFEYYPSDLTKFQFVVLLQHQISPLPYGFTSMVRYSYKYAYCTVKKPWENKVQDVNYGLRFSFNLFDTDFSFSYYNGNFSLPVMDTLDINVVVNTGYTYAKAKIIGFDFSGEFKGVGFWGEIGYIMPDKVKAHISTLIEDNGTFYPYYKEFQLLEDSYFKYVFGIDYNFGNGFYGNIQFLHGFFDEFSYTDDAKKNFQLRKGVFFGEIENYISGRIEKKFSGDEVKVSFDFMEEIGDKNSLTFMPSMTYKPQDGFEVLLGGFIVLSGDKERTKFGMFKDDKLLYISFKLTF